MQSKTKYFISIIMLCTSDCDSKPVKSKIDNPLAGHVKALDNAKDVERQLLEAQKKTQDAINKATE